jgi:hypothetical protein
MPGVVQAFRMVRQRPSVLIQIGGTIQVDGTFITSGRMEMQGGVLSGNGTVRDNSYTGPTDFAVMNIAGRIAPGGQRALSVLTLDAGLQSGTGSVLDIDIQSGTLFDVLQVTRNSVLAGLIDVHPLDATFVPTLGQRFRVGTFAAGSPMFPRSAQCSF